MANWKNKIVVITGGSEGLGLAIGQAFAAEGAITVVLARTESRLKEAVENAFVGNPNLDWVVCDVTSDQSVAEAVSEIIRRHQRIDVWVNNVGKSTRIKFEECSPADYQNLIEMNFHTAVRCTLAVMEYLVASSGQVVNIGSLASKTAWPHVAPYSVSKHALASFSHQFRLEGPKNVNCLHVCPGPIRRSDGSVRYDKQAKGLSENARKPGAGVKLKGIPPEVLAKKIVSFCGRRKKELVMPWYTRILFAITQISPTIGDWLLKKAAK